MVLWTKLSHLSTQFSDVSSTFFTFSYVNYLDYYQYGKVPYPSATSSLLSCFATKTCQSNANTKTNHIGHIAFDNPMQFDN